MVTGTILKQENNFKYIVTMITSNDRVGKDKVAFKNQEHFIQQQLFYGN
jgi:hypothetical protein